MTESAAAGNVYAFAPSGFQVFSDRLRSSVTIDPKSGSNTFGQWLHRPVLVWRSSVPPPASTW